MAALVLAGSIWMLPELIMNPRKDTLTFFSLNEELVLQEPLED